MAVSNSIESQTLRISGPVSAGRAYRIGSQGTLQLVTLNNQMPAFISRQTVTAEQFANGTAPRAVNVQRVRSGGVFVGETGGAIPLGARLQSDSLGRAIVATTGTVFAVAQEAAAGAGVFISMAACGGTPVVSSFPTPDLTIAPLGTAVIPAVETQNDITFRFPNFQWTESGAGQFDVFAIRPTADGTPDDTQFRYTIDPGFSQTEFSTRIGGGIQKAALLTLLDTTGFPTAVDLVWSIQASASGTSLIYFDGTLVGFGFPGSMAGWADNAELTVRYGAAGQQFPWGDFPGSGNLEVYYDFLFAP